MLSGELSINKYLCMPVHSTEIEHQSLSLPLFWNGEFTLIPERIVLCNGTADSRKSGLYSKRNENLTILAV